MPTAGKVFVYRENLPLVEIHDLLKGYRETVEYDTGEETMTLIKDITELNYSEKELSGLYSSDAVETKYHRSGSKSITYTRESKFYFFEQEGRNYVLVMAPKHMANVIANSLSLILHGVVGSIIVSRMNPRLLREFCEGSEAIKVLLFEDLDIPNLEKATMYGFNIVQMDLYNKFVDSGLYRYSVSKLTQRQNNHTVGIVRDGSICIFTSIEAAEYVDFIKDEIVPMIL